MRSSEPADPSDARFEEKRRELGYAREVLLATPGLCPGRHRTTSLPLSAEPAGRYRPAATLEGAVL